MQIADPGDNCYIAIGLTCKNYPKNRHPGWDKGSIAYHADDGKIFIGHGSGDPFGPKCRKGDIMGCGIMFPPGYRENNDSDDEDRSDQSDSDYAEDFQPDAAEEDDEYQQGHREEGAGLDEGLEDGIKVEVFFTRNGTVVGRREIPVPRGGFYPTVGMLSNFEKVIVDLRPLTG
jgi:hypothetical protein